MQRSPTRRGFLKAGATAGVLTGMGDLGFLSHLPAVSAQETAARKSPLRLDSGITPLVRLIEDTPREQLLEEVGARVRQGLGYRELLAALQLVGVLNIEPRPSVGFQFHAVLVVNACHLASMSSPAEHRWLPIFWALDHYKSSAARDVRERGDWVMPAVDEAALPPADRAREAFVTAMEAWDEPAADAAVAALARTAGINEVYEAFFQLGARDFRAIGHKAIFVANSLRTLQSIGWEHGEPIVRSLANALLLHESSSPAQRDDPADRPYRRNLELAQTIRPEWRGGAIDPGATEELLQALRTGSNNDCCDLVADLLNRGVAPQSVWDALQLAAGELLMRQPGIVAIHAVTTTNALHYAYQTTASDDTRRLMLLQCAAFLPMFRESMTGRGSLAATTINDLQPAADATPSDPAAAREAIFAAMGDNPQQAARQLLSHLQQPGTARDFIDAARLLVFLKGNDAHDYKFSAAIMEDYTHVSPQYRDTFLALSSFNLQNTRQRDSSLVDRTRNALS